MRWGELRPVQVEAIHAILEGQGHLVIAAPTAGGKTEAAFLPIISQIAAQQQPSIQALYIGPLKALINDQFSRLDRLCDAVDIPVHRWHGDVTASRKQHVRRNPSGILLITPESLESNFINYPRQVEKMYRHLQFVVIDELHSFLENVRGMHLRSLLTRLNALANIKPRIVGLSATLGDPETAKRFIDFDSPSEVTYINDPNASREIRLIVKAFVGRPPSESEETVAPRATPAEALQYCQRLTAANLKAVLPFTRANAPELAPTKAPIDPDAPALPDELDEIADDIMRHFTNSTNLVFVNAKATIEVLADKLNQRVEAARLPNNPFVVHHGSLSKELREDAESQLKDPAPTTAICSSTLEMGIDIGGVRTVGQVDPPSSVTSLVQRLGRSGRREGEAAILRMFVRDEGPSYKSELTDLLYPRLLRAVAITKLMLEKWLESPNTNRLHLSTLVHQVMSCLRQTGGMQAADLHALLLKTGPFRQVDTPMFGKLLRALAARKIIEQMKTGELILAPTGERITANKDFYASFQSPEEYTLCHSDKPIGQVEVATLPPPGEVILFGARRWLVERIEPDTKRVIVSPTRKGKPPRFLGEAGDMHPRIAQEMRELLRTDHEPPWLDNSGRLLLRAARHAAYQAGLCSRTILAKDRGIQWFPWAGSRSKRTLAAIAAQNHVDLKADSLSLTYRLSSLVEFKAFLKESISATYNATELAAFVLVRSAEKFDGLLGQELNNYAVGKEQLDIAAAKQAAEGAIAELEAT
jgi:ATP-dependent Lhr-like helicase